MSYENTDCPCGGKKDRETLICNACALHIFESTDRFELDHWQDGSFTKEARRSMAIRLLTMARRRTRRLPLQFSAER
jgi:hypothetical protein